MQYRCTISGTSNNVNNFANSFKGNLSLLDFK